MCKKWLFGVCSMICVLGVAGCSINVNAPDKSVKDTSVKDTVVSENEEVKEDSKKIVPKVKEELPERLGTSEESTDIDEFTDEVETGIVVEESSELAVVETSDVNWKDLKFNLDGVDYCIYDGIAVSDFESMGWYQSGDTETLEAGTYVIANYDNDIYEGASLTLCIGNKTDSDISIDEGLVYNVDYCANYGWSLADNYPDIDFCGIGVGASIDDVESVLGKPNDIWESDKSTIYTYNDGDGSSVKITFIDGIGASEFDMKWVSWSF